MGTRFQLHSRATVTRKETVLVISTYNWPTPAVAPKENVLLQEKVSELEECLDVVESEVTELKKSMSRERVETGDLNGKLASVVEELAHERDLVNQAQVKVKKELEQSFCGTVHSLTSKYFPECIPNISEVQLSDDCAKERECSGSPQNKKRANPRAGGKNLSVYKQTKDSHTKHQPELDDAENVGGRLCHEELMGAVESFNSIRKDRKSLGGAIDENDFTMEMETLEFWILRVLVDVSLLGRENDRIREELTSAVTKVRIMMQIWRIPTIAWFLCSTSPRCHLPCVLKSSNTNLRDKLPGNHHPSLGT